MDGLLNLRELSYNKDTYSYMIPFLLFLFLMTIANKY